MTLSKLKRILEVMWSEDGGKTKFFVYFSFISSSVLLALAWSADITILTMGVNSIVELHLINSDIRKYFETLLCVFGITVIQFYQYHISTVGVYDRLSPNDIGNGKAKFAHTSLQILAATSTFFAGLVLFKFLFVSIFSFDIENNYNVNIEKLTYEYLPFLELKWLFLYFAMLDFFLLKCTINYCNNSHLSLKNEKELKLVKSDFKLSIAIGLLAFSYNFFIVEGIVGNNYLIKNNLSPYDTKDYMSLFAIYFLQAGYIFSNFLFSYRKTEHNLNC